METLRSLREALLELHKALLDAERITYERMHGRQTAAAFLQAVVHEEGLAWLRPWTALIVRIDALLALPASELSHEERTACSVEACRLVALPGPDGPGAVGRYGELLQQSPDVVLAHRSLRRALAA